MATADKRLYLTADRERLVADGDPDAAFLFASEGEEISDEDAKRYGLTKAAPKSEDKRAPTAANKAVTKAANK